MSDDSFAALFEAQAKTARPQTSIRIGAFVEGIVSQVSQETVFVELDGKRQGFIEASELLNPDGTLSCAVGDKLSAKVLAVDGAAGNVRLGRSMGRVDGISGLEQARAARIPVEGKVSGTNKGGLEVDLGKNLRAFCPLSQMGLRQGADPKEFVGQSLQFHVTDIKDGGRNIVVSRRSVLESESKDARARVLSTLAKGQTVQGTITAVRDFGAFVDIGGLEALVPASELSHDRSKPVTERVRAGERVEAVVLDIKTDEKGDTKVSLSVRALLPAPEGGSAPQGGSNSKIAIGSIVKGAVTRIEAYGVFVQVEGTEGRSGRGLVPQQELNVSRGTDLRKAFPEGTVLTAKVLETGDGKLKLSVRGAVDHAERVDFESHREAAGGAKNFGTLGDLLKKMKK